MQIQQQADYSTMYCIVGAGAAGIVAAKNLSANQIPFEILERQDEVGGNWYYGSDHSVVYKSTHLISSKPLTEYPDYPMPAAYPDYPNHAQVLAYLRDYAHHFGLYKAIQFNTSVQKIERTENGHWAVTCQQNNETFTRIYGGVILANGHLAKPRYPVYPGQFSGLILHSRDYRTPDILRDKRVLVVGAGNSGCDIAVEGAQNAQCVFLSTRRGYYFIPKYILGKPADQVGETAIKLGLPLALRRMIDTFIIKIVLGDPRQFGLLKPDHKLFESHPLVNSQMFYYLGHGDITPKPDIEELCGTHIRFKDGSEEPIDVLVYATGYMIDFPCIDQKYLNWQGDGPRLFMHTFHPQYDNLFVVGLIQPDSGIFWLMDHQAQLIAQFIAAQKTAPEKARHFQQIKAKPQTNPTGSRHINSVRHFLEVEHHRYSQQLKRLKSLL